jgi:hypothetical protein
METPGLPVANLGSRRNEDIALDLLKFVATHAEIAKGVGAVGFQQSGSAKGDEIASKLLDLYGRCLVAVQGGRK